MVGIDTAIYSPTGGSVGIGFAIPVQCRQAGRGAAARSWQCGARLAGRLDAASDPGAGQCGGPEGHQRRGGGYGEPDSPAQQADIRQGDVITAFNGKPITDARDLAMAVANTASGQKASMTVWRDGGSHTLPVTIGNEAGKTHVASAADSAVPAQVPHPVGMSLAPLTPEAKSQLNLKAQASGVLVNQVTPGGHADDSGVEAGDVILRVNGDKVTSPDQVVNAIRNAEQQNKNAIAIQVMRNGQPAYLGLQLA